MLNSMYLQVLDMSKTAGIVILVVILARLLLKRAPKAFSYGLWAVVLFRLLCPVTIEAPVSIVPEMASVSQGYTLSEESISVFGAGEAAYQAVGDALNGGLGIQHVRTTEKTQTGMSKYVSTDWRSVWILFGRHVWMAGMAAMLIYSAGAYLKIRKKLSVAIPLRENIFIADDIKSPFVVGLFRPKIYLPCNLEEKEQTYIILHEQHHIKRLDHIVKALAFLALAMHWFNPLVWVAFVLASKDMEMSCDEAVIRKVGGDIRADYAASLLTLATGRRMIAGTPLAFGEGDTRGRIYNLSKWKKPAVWIVIAAVVTCIGTAICLSTNPTSKNTIVLGANYDIEEVLYAVTVGDEVSAEPPLQYCITADYHLYDQQEEGGDWNYLGALTPYKLTNDELNSYMPVEEMRKAAKLRQITDSYILKVADDNFYLVFQTKNGKTYLAYGWEDVEERGQAGSDDTRLRRLYRLESSFYSGYVNVNFFQRSLINTVGNYVYNFASFESDKIPGYHISGFKSGDSINHTEMNDLGFAVFQTTGEGYRLIDCKVYENAALVENGIFFCSDPAIADVNGEMRNDNTFDILLILNEDVDKVERVYHAEGKEDLVQADTYINAPYMSVWSWEYSDAATSVSQYVYDKKGNKLSYDSVIPLNSASWQDLPDDTDGTVTEWFNYLNNPSEMETGLTAELPEYPGVTFQFTRNQILASKPFNHSDLTGHVILIGGMPIWNAYFTDLTGDGYPDICATYTHGSGIIDSRIVICDYVNGASYELSDRGYHDFTLWLNETDGQLYVDKRVYPNGELISSGRLVYEDDCIQIIEAERTTVSITDIEDPTKTAGFSYDTAMEKFFEDETNEYYFSGIYSQYVIVHYTDGTQEDIVSALNAGRATFADLDKFGIRYWAEPKPSVSDVLHQD